MCVRTSRRWRSLEEEEEEKRNPRITKESLRRMCKEQKLYITPDLNDVLYLHYKGYSKIENLEEYTGLKCLWLENNGIDRIENLDNQKDLRSLYLHNNLIKEIENLEGACPLLDSLNLCHNSVSKIQNLSKLEHLHTLQISHNRLQDFADVEHLKDCKELSCVDLQHNCLDDPSIVDIFEAMPSLRVLYLMGNPVVKKIPSYRKNLTVRCKMLTYLDDRPVFPKDRAAAEAWSEGGLEAEKACRQKWADDERAKIDASVKGLLALRDKAKAEKYKQEMKELVPRSDSEREAEEQEEWKVEEEEEQEEVGGSDNENLEAGDSEGINHNGIIFPWNLEQDSRSRNRNELGEGGRSLIVELPDPNETETKVSKSVRRKSPNDPEIKSKLHEALLSAEWLQEKSPEGDKLEEATMNTVETGAEKVVDETSSCESADSFPETKALEEDYMEDEEEIEKGALDNLVKEKELAYHKYMAKTEEEILPNISHFAFGQDEKPQEKSLGSEIEELLRIEKEEMEKVRMESEDEEMRKENKKKLIEEIEEKEKFGTVEAEGNVKDNKVLDDVTQQKAGPPEPLGFPKDLVRTEVENIIKEAIDALNSQKLMSEEEANEALDNGVRMINELNNIGRFPLTEKAANVQNDSPPSSDDEFEDVEEESGLTLSEEFPLMGGVAKNKLEPQESEEYYSIFEEMEEESSPKCEREAGGKTDGPGLEATRDDENTREEEVDKFEPGRKCEAETDIIEQSAVTVGREKLEESCIRIYKKNVTTSLELQIVTEADEENSHERED